MMKFFLEDERATLAFGQALAHCYIQEAANNMDLPPLMMQGALGSGKTTLVRGFVNALPGADQAEVSSPSFNIFNLYPTTPETAHFDIYRLEGAYPGDELFDFLDDTGVITIIEWFQYLDKAYQPQNALTLIWQAAPQSGRIVNLNATGQDALAFLDRYKEGLEQFSEGLRRG
ncbi:MAG: tRNA (adenosine(37)-N6)-threonylcarbamoyltransferase complex ATPase subunit type 1 TsaE [Desulfovibrio sp.]